MDIEQLKLVMETLMQMGAQGKEAFIWWLVFDKALVPLAWLVLTPFVAWVVATLFGRVIESESRLRAIRDACGIGTRGWVSDDEFRELMQRVKSGD